MHELEGILRQAREGSKDAFCRIVRFYQVQVRSYLARTVDDKAVVDDLAQETFLDAYLSLASYEPGRPFGAWLLGIARHRLLRFLDAERKRPREGAAGALADGRREQVEADPEFAPDRHERRMSALRTCLEGLAPHSASLVQAYYMKGRTAGEIAREQGRTENGIWVAMLRIRQALRRCVEARLQTAEDA